MKEGRGGGRGKKKEEGKIKKRQIEEGEGKLRSWGKWMGFPKGCDAKYRVPRIYTNH